MVKFDKRNSDAVRNLCGGRITKHAGQAASYAPEAGSWAALAPLKSSVSAIALSAALLVGPVFLPDGLTGASRAHAGTCAETPAGSGIWSCYGPATGGDVTQSPTPVALGALTVSTDPLFGITTAAGNAFTLVNTAAETSITFTDINNSTITGQEIGIRAINYGSELLSITTSGVTTGNTDEGIIARNDGTSLTIDAAETTGERYGIFARNFGSELLSITTSGATTGKTRDGILAVNSNGTSLTIDAAETTGARFGILARNSGSDLLSITTSGITTGNTDEGIFARNTGTSLTIDAAETTGERRGINARNYGSEFLSITTSGVTTGKTDYGIFARNLNGTSLTIDAAETTGRRFGILARNYGRDLLSITTSGATTGNINDGIYARNDGTSLTIDAAETTGGRDGIRIGHQGSGNLLVRMDGAVYGGTYGVHNESSSQGGAFTITSGGSLSGGSGVALQDNADGTNGNAASSLSVYGGLKDDAVMGAGSDMITIHTDASVAAGVDLDGGDATTTGNDDDLVFNGWTGALDGQIINFELVDLTNNSNVTFSGASIGQDANSAVLLFEVEDGSTAFFQNSFLINGNFNNFGALDLSTANLVADTVLTITGNYAAASDLLLDVVLNDGGLTNVQPNDQAFADQMIVQGSVSNVTSVFINNTGGAGAATDRNGNGLVDPDEGILIVQVEGNNQGNINDAAPLEDSTAATGTLSRHFVLGAAGNTFSNPDTGRQNVVPGGVYAYDIYAINPDASQNDVWDFVLAAAFQPAAPVYEALQAALLSMETMPTLQQRVGNRYWSSYGGSRLGTDGAIVSGFGADGDASLTQPSAVWARIEAGHQRIDPDSSTTSSYYTIDQWQMKGGVEGLVLGDAGGNALIAGLTAHFGASQTSVNSPFGNGSIDLTGYGVGATMTWYRENGLYLDGQGQYSWYEGDLSSGILGELSDDLQGTGYSLSIEAGQRMEIGNGRVITPQAQLVWASVEFDDFSGPFGETVELEDGDNLKGRVGISTEYERMWQAANGDNRRSNLYTLANLHYQFIEETRVEVSSTQLSSAADRLSGELGVGGSYVWGNGQYSLYSEASAATSLENPGNSNRFKGNVGIRMKW